jgi:predicted ArsR family transcriptional regulator
MEGMREFTEADRPAILDLLKIHGPSNAPALAALRRVRENAVRQQLSALEREGLVERRLVRRPVGRPTHLYALTPKAEALFPQAYGALALSLLRRLRKTDGERKIDRLFRERTRELAAAYRKRLEGKSLPEKWKELARLRDLEGYMARGGAQGLTEHHCPIAAVARELPQACLYEKLLFEAVLGKKLDRVEHLASGGRACVYRLAPASSPAPPGRPPRRRPS